MKLQFLTATTDQHSNQVVDWDNSQYDLVLDINQQKLDVFSQEIQLTGVGARSSGWAASTTGIRSRTIVACGGRSTSSRRA